MICGQLIMAVFVSAIGEAQSGGVELSKLQHLMFTNNVR